MKKQIRIHAKIGKEDTITITKVFNIPKALQADCKKINQYLEKKSDAIIKEIIKNGIGSKVEWVDVYGDICEKIKHQPPHKITEIEAIYPEEC